jgi:formylglycine-generating enzyme required for sulfatase activity
MFIKYLALSKRAFLIILAASIGAYADGTVQFEIEDEVISVPVEIVDKMPTLQGMMTDLGIDIKQTQSPMPLYNIKVAPFKEIIGILSKVEEEHANNTAKGLSESDQEIAEKLIKEMPKSLDELLSIIKTANFLDVKSILGAGAKVFAKTSSTMASSFHSLLPEIRRLIIKSMSPSEFMALIQANPQADGTPEEEGSFRIALSAHFPGIEAAQGETAKEHYIELNKGNVVLNGSVIAHFVSIPGGNYEIGSPPTEKGRYNSEELHSVELSPFSIMDAAVTQEAYAMVMGTNPSKFKEAKYCPESFKEIEVNGVKIPVCADHPVEYVSWNDAEAFAKRMNELDPKHSYSLPTEAQLEVAFRGETKTAYVSGRDDETGLGDYVWYEANSGNQTHPVKSKLANAFGIYRSSVSEWAHDWYDANYAGSTGLDPQGPASGSYRVIRGGGWYNGARFCRSAYRDYGWPGSRNEVLGFRLVRTVALGTFTL